MTDPHLSHGSTVRMDVPRTQWLCRTQIIRLTNHWWQTTFLLHPTVNQSAIDTPRTNPAKHTSLAHSGAVTVSHVRVLLFMTNKGTISNLISVQCRYLIVCHLLLAIRRPEINGLGMIENLLAATTCANWIGLARASRQQNLSADESRPFNGFSTFGNGTGVMTAWDGDSLAKKDV